MTTCFGDDIFGCVDVFVFDKKNGCAGLSALLGDVISVEGACRGEVGITIGWSALFPSDAPEDREVSMSLSDPVVEDTLASSFTSIIDETVCISFASPFPLRAVSTRSSTRFCEY